MSTVMLVLVLWVIKIGALCFIFLILMLVIWQRTPPSLRSEYLHSIIPLNDKFGMMTLLSNITDHQKINTDLFQNTPFDESTHSFKPNHDHEITLSPIEKTSPDNSSSPLYETSSTVTPTASFTPSLTPTASFTPSLTPTASFTPSLTPTASPTPSYAPTSTPTSTSSEFTTIVTEPATITATMISSPQPLIGTPIPLLNWVSPPGKMCSPLEGFSLRELPNVVSSPYNPPPPGSDARHQGVDFAYYRNNGQLTIEGKEVYSILPGKVIGVVDNRLPYGNTIVIETRYSDIAAPLADTLSITRDTSLYHLYAHLQDSPLLALGTRVKCGDLIGHVGKSGTIVPHLHLETRMGPAGGWLPSMGFFDEDATEEEKANYLFWRISGVYKHFDPMTLFDTYLSYEANNSITSGGE